MSTAPIARTWLAFAALGVGTIHLALVVASPVLLQVVLVVLGLTEFGWGVLALIRDDLVFARAARIAALAPVIAWSLIVVVATLFDAGEMAQLLPLIPMTIASVFGLWAAWMLSRHLRRVPDATVPLASESGSVARTAADPVPSVGRYLGGVFAGALVAGLLVSPALAATSAGASATSHGGHGATAPTSEFESPVEDPLTRLNLPNHDASH